MLLTGSFIKVNNFLFLFLLLLIGCENSNKSLKKPKELYGDGLLALKNTNYETAAEHFIDFDRFYPDEKLSFHAQLLSGYAFFMARKYNDAIDAFLIFIRLNPQDSHVDYAHYMLGMCYYAQTQHVERDHEVVERAGQAFEELIEKFPHSVYAKDARLKMDYIRSHLAAKEMNVARYYQFENNCIGALKRFSYVVENFPKTIYTAEALFRITECQKTIGLNDEARQTLKVLKINFPKSQWFQKAKVLMND
jgi:outer membrane protein assembly factor BamD